MPWIVHRRHRQSRGAIEWDRGSSRVFCTRHRPGVCHCPQHPQARAKRYGQRQVHQWTFGALNEVLPRPPPWDRWAALLGAQGRSSQMSWVRGSPVWRLLAGRVREYRPDARFATYRCFSPISSGSELLFVSVPAPSVRPLRRGIAWKLADRGEWRRRWPFIAHSHRASLEAACPAAREGVDSVCLFKSVGAPNFQG